MKFAPIAGLLLASLLGCGTPGVPLPPSLDLPQPVQDLRASRKGDTVTLFWTVPRQTTDRTNIRLRRLGPTSVCRSLTVAMTECADQVKEVDTPALVTAGEAAAEAKAKANANASNKKPQPAPAKAAPIPASATDVLPQSLEQKDRKSTRLNSSHPSISYAVFC